tara:strand:- start:36 stop:1235 length:1200 start_codon:yes stop_codon:yes gene_type:complete
MHYTEAHEQDMISFYESLSEKDKRRYAAIEAKKLGHGGIDYICCLFGCDYKTVKKGTDDLTSEELLKQSRIRASGSGRAKLIDTLDGINEAFLDVLKESTAGDPMNDKVKWTSLDKTEIAKALKKKGFSVSRNIVKSLLNKHGYVKRKAKKVRSTGEFKERDRQFKKIARLTSQYSREDNPVISVDTKKKEKLGNLYRDGELYCLEAEVVYDHDFPNLSEGQVIPHGIYDIQHNDAMVNIGTSADTAEFACDSVKLWWDTVGIYRYPRATSLLLLADCGGSNSYRHHIFKDELQTLANDIKLEIRVAHYPPYTSKWNPIEHRLFPHVTRAMSGVVFKSYDLVKELVENTQTKAGLTVTSNIINKVYETGKTACENLYKNGTIIFDKVLNSLNYKVRPLA